jgi:hypothetical protein
MTDSSSGHCPGKLSDFLDHLNGVHENNQFTMKTEKYGHLPLLDIDIYRKPDGSLGHKVYCKPMHTNLNSNSHHRPCNKHADTQGQIPLWLGKPTWWTVVSQGQFQAEQLQRSADLTGCQYIRESHTGPRETCLSCLLALHEYNFQLHQQAAVQAQHQVCGPPPKEDCQFPSTCEGRLGTQHPRRVQRALWVVRSTLGRLAIPSRPG